MSFGCATPGSRLPSAWTAATDPSASSPCRMARPTKPVAPARATVLFVTPFVPRGDSSTLAALLGRQPAAELLRGALGQLLAGVRRDQGVGPDSFPTPLQALPQSRSVRVRREQDVAGCGAEEGEAILEVLNRGGVLAAVGEAKALGRYRRHAVGVDEAQAAFAFARLPSPTRPAGRVAGGEVGGEFDAADAEGLAVAQGVGPRDERHGRDAAELRVALSHPRLRQHLDAPRACRHARAAQPLQLSYSAAVIEMHVRVDDELHVFDAEPERAYVGDDLRD